MKNNLITTVQAFCLAAAFACASALADPASPVKHQEPKIKPLPGAVASGEKDMIPGTWIQVSEAVELKGLTPSTDGKTLGYVKDGGQAVFGPLAFTDGLVDRLEIELAAPRSNGSIECRLDSSSGPKIAGMNIPETGGYNAYAVVKSPCEQLAGTHRVFLVLRGGDNLCNLKAFRFLKPGQKGDPKAIDPEAKPDPKDIEAEISEILAANHDAIEKNRTTLITLRTTPGATVSVKQTRHAFQFGTAINRRAFVPDTRVSEADQKKYKEILKANFNSVVHENAMKWYSNERAQDKVTYAKADTMLAWCEQNGLYTRGHCVYWGRDKYVQGWLKGLDDEGLRKQIKERAADYIGHFKGRVTEFDVNNEMLHCHYYEKRLGPGIRKQMFAWCHALDPEATLYVNDYSMLSGGATGGYVKQIQGFLDAGMKIGGIGVQGHFGSRVTGSQVKKTLDLLAQFNVPIKVTEFDVNTKDDNAKALALATLYATAFAHPAVEGIYMWGFWEKLHWRPRAALWKADGSETLAAKWYRDLVFNRWWTNFEGKADVNGICEVRVFYGEHDVTVNGKTHRISVGEDAENVIIDLK